MNVPNTYGVTPLHAAVMRRNEELVRLLLAAPGIDASKPNAAGKSPYDLAVEKGLDAIAELLKNHR